MATSSITHNFVISGKERVERFVAALEESERNRSTYAPVSAKEIKDETELRELMVRWKKAREKANIGGK